MRATCLSLTLLTALSAGAEEPSAERAPTGSEAKPAPDAKVSLAAPPSPGRAEPAREESRPSEPVELPDGAELEVGIAEVGSAVSIAQSNLGSSTQTLPSMEGTLKVGGYFRGHHSLQLGLGFSYSSTSQFGSDFTLIDVVIAPTYRYHFVPLRPWGLSPFVDVEVQLSVVHTSGSGFGADTTVIPFGAAAGLGGEYLFGDRLGFVVLAGARYVTYSFGSSPGVSNTGTTVTAIQVWGAAAVSLHF